MTASVAEKVADEVESICSYFVITNGFNAVKMMDTSTYYYLIYLVPDDYMSENGRTTYTYYTSTNRSTGSSYICMKYSRAEGDVSEYGVTLAHEFMHAIMATYSVFSGDDANWFRESFASMSAMVYYGKSTDLYNDYVTSYLANCEKSIYSTSDSYIPYGALLYPLYIYEYLGGWDAIKSIYNELADADTVYEAITNSSYTTTYQLVFREMAKRNYKPIDYYPYATSSWGTAKIYSATMGSTSGFGIAPMACNYRRYTSTENVGTVYFTSHISSGDGTGLMLACIRESASGAISLSNIAVDFSKVTVAQSNFGSTIQKVTLLFLNYNTSGSYIICSIDTST
ncbi:MAG: hypothetical protein LUH43_03880, partial [Clostridia bacterium]|nr:hypothetical protein [Clostridia bacterium]